MKFAQRISNDVATTGAAEAMDIAIESAIACDHNWTLEISKYTLDDNSVLVFKGAEVYGIDADDAESIRGYAVWLWTNTADATDADRATEHAEIIRLLEALN